MAREGMRPTFRIVLPCRGWPRRQGFWGRISRIRYGNCNGATATAVAPPLCLKCRYVTYGRSRRYVYVYVTLAQNELRGGRYVNPPTPRTPAINPPLKPKAASARSAESDAPARARHPFRRGVLVTPPSTITQEQRSVVNV